jgi:sugar O-acyltransferase (sialic acid O-acetyltransferase NeuD family)
MVSSLPVAIVGNGRTSLAIRDALRVLGRSQLGTFVEDRFLDGARGGSSGVRRLGDLVKLSDPDSCEVFVAIGYQDLNEQRSRVAELLESQGFRLATLVSPGATVSPSANIEPGCFVGPFVDIQDNVSVGKGSFVWSSSTVGHGSKLERFTWISAGTSIGGDAVIGSKCFLGLGSVVSHGVHVGDSCFIGATALASKDLDPTTALMSASSVTFGGAARRVLDLMELGR